MEAMAQKAESERRAPPRDISAIYRSEVHRVARFARSLAGPTIEVDDVVQEVFLTAHRLLSEFRGDSHVSTWLYRITANAIYARRRKEKFRQLFTFTSDTRKYDVVAHGPSPLEEMERQQSSATVYRMLDQLPEKLRTVFILFEIDELSGEEISELTGVSLPTVWVRLSRARKKLLERVKKQRGSDGR